MRAIAAPAWARRSLAVPVRKFITHSIQASTRPGTSASNGERPVAARPLASKNSAKIGSASSRARTGQAAAGEFEVVGGRRRERLAERLLQLEPHRHHHLGDQGLLGREVVHDGAVVDAEPLGHASERELAEPVVHRRGERPVEDLLFGVSVTHPGLDCSDHYEYGLQLSLQIMPNRHHDPRPV